MGGKRKAAPKAKSTRRSKRRGQAFARKITFNPPDGHRVKRPTIQEEVLEDEDLAGRFIGRFGGAGQPPLSKP